ncbi:MAG: hypothetical protein ABH883_08910 [Candidatus Omnitrophota bacterium]
MKKNTGKIDNLVFLEFVDEAKAYLKSRSARARHGAGKDLIISFHPVVKAFMADHGIQCADSFHFCPAASHKKLLAELEKYSIRFRAIGTISDRTGVKGSYTETLLFSFRGNLSTWLYRVEVLYNAVTMYRPGKVMCPDAGKIRAEKSLWTEEGERYLYDIARQVCSRENTDIEGIPVRIGRRNGKSLPAGRGDGLVRAIFCRLAGLLIKPGRNMILVPSESHDIEKAFCDIRKETGEYDLAFLGPSRKVKARDILLTNGTAQGKPYRYLFFNTDRKVPLSADFIRQKRSLSDEIEKWVKEISYRGVSPALWLGEKYRKAFVPEIIDRTYFQAANINRFLDKNRPLLVMSQHSRCMTSVIGELCGIKDIPSLMIPHGSFTSVPDEYSLKEWKENAIGIVNTPYKYLAMQTPLIEGFIRDVKVKSKPVVTGPLIFARKICPGEGARLLRRRYAPGGEKIILHAGTPKHRKAQRFLNYETIDEYVDGIAALIKAVNKIENARLIIRYRVIDGLGTEELKKILPVSDSCYIASEGSFADYLSIADLLVSYSSSTMEEAVQNNIPVLLFNKYGRYRHINGAGITAASLQGTALSAVYNVDSEQDLIPALNWILKNHLSRDRNELKYLFDGYKYKDEETVKIPDLIRGS